LRSLYYRPDIDGLRAIAVAGVVVYHLQSLGLVKGGFLGVDVFFVISGYLITNLILSQRRDGAFTLREFYLRRAARLLPVFIVVAISTAAASLAVLEPARMLEFTHSLISSMFGVSNFYFLFQDPYWSEGTQHLPLLHTWSLAVEEQFYLVFPMALLTLQSFFSRDLQVAFFSLLGFASFLASVLVSEVSPTSAFYLLPTRAWELLVGVVLALLLERNQRRPNQIIGGLQTGAGLLMILFSFVYLGKVEEGPGFSTVIPVVGAALVIFGGLVSNPISRALAFKPLVALGLISYGLYLWHFPILALGGVTFPLSITGELFAVLVALTFAIVTYFTIERPLRKPGHRIGFIVFASSGLVTVMVFSICSVVTSGYSSRGGGIPWPEEGVSSSSYGAIIEAEGAIGSLVVVGDSHMVRLISGISAHANDLGFKFVDGTIGGCPLLAGVGVEGDECTFEVQNDRLSFLEKLGPSIIVLGGRFPLYIERDRFNNFEGGVEWGPPLVLVRGEETDSGRENQKDLVQESIRSTIEILLDQGHKIVLIYPIPEVGWDVPMEIVARSSAQATGLYSNLPIPHLIRKRLLPGEDGWPLDRPVTTSHKRYLERTRSSFEALDSINDARILRVYPDDIFCDDFDRCLAHNQEDIFYTDDDHLSSVGANILVQEIINKIRNF